MSHFTRNAVIQPVPKTSLRKLVNDVTWYAWSYDDETDTGTLPITPPIWYVFDWASTPTNLFAVLCLFSVFISPWFSPLAVLWYYMQRTESSTILWSVIHDYLYTDKEKFTRITRWIADRIALDIRIACWTNKYKALLMYLWIRLWWRFYWYGIYNKLKDLFNIGK